MEMVDSKKIFDLHTHHYRCGHAEGEIEEYINAAIQNGLDIIGISDHSPFFYSDKDQLHPGIAMKKSEFHEYINEVLSLKEKYKGQIEILLGMESDFFPDHIELYKAKYKGHPFDYVIGSVHFVNGASVFDRNYWDSLSHQEKIVHKETYYRLIQQSAESGLFQVLGHIDVMKTNCPDFTDIPTDITEHMFKEISKYDIAIEINTSGAMKGCGSFPTNELLERALYFGVDVTFGSDAHIPNRVGERFEEVQQNLKEIGFKKWCFFRNKQKIYVPL